MRARVLLEVRTHIKLGSKILEQGLGGWQDQSAQQSPTIIAAATL